MALTYDVLEPVNQHSGANTRKRVWPDSDAFVRPHGDASFGDAEVVLMAGGNGKRLAPLTDARPKPLLEVGSRPIIDTIVSNFAAQGLGRIWLSVNYLGEMIENYFGNGADWGVEIRYLRENAPLGTAGAISLLPEEPKSPILVMNADVLTDLDFVQLLGSHKASGACATVCVREQHISIPYGVVESESGYLCAISEKPTQSYFINAGIYVLSPNAVRTLGDGEPVDMPQVLAGLMEGGERVAVHKLDGYWCDIGQKQDLDRANAEFDEYFT